ncbi:hypothetical protein D3C74_234260 [compost metagenome]
MYIQKTSILSQPPVGIETGFSLTDRLARASKIVIGFGNNCIYQAMANKMLVDYGMLERRRVL